MENNVRNATQSESDAVTVLRRRALHTDQRVLDCGTPLAGPRLCCAPAAPKDTARDLVITTADANTASAGSGGAAQNLGMCEPCMLHGRLTSSNLALNAFVLARAYLQG